MLQIQDQSFKVPLFVPVLGLAKQPVPVAIGQFGNLRVMVQVGHDQAFITAVRLVLDKLSGLKGKLIQ